HPRPATSYAAGRTDLTYSLKERGSSRGGGHPSVGLRATLADPLALEDEGVAPGSMTVLAYWGGRPAPRPRCHAARPDLEPLQRRTAKSAYGGAALSRRKQSYSGKTREDP